MAVVALRMNISKTVDMNLAWPYYLTDSIMPYSGQKTRMEIKP
jgi:hypothetical protein